MAVPTIVRLCIWISFRTEHVIKIVDNNEISSDRLPIFGSLLIDYK